MAIKIVEHSLKGEAAELEGARESLLAASISHPNVVRMRSLAVMRSCTATLLACTSAICSNFWKMHARDDLLQGQGLAGGVLTVERPDAWQVACYKICTVKLNRTQSDEDDAVAIDSEEALVQSVMRDSSQDSLSRRCAPPAM